VKTVAGEASLRMACSALSDFGTLISMNDPIEISRIGQIAVTVEDIDRAEAFYRDVLGIKHLFRAGERMTFFECSGVRLMLGLPEPGQSFRPGSIIYLVVADIEAEFSKLEASGASIVQGPHRVAKMSDYDLWIGFFGDGEGNTLGLMCERKNA